MMMMMRQQQQHLSNMQALRAVQCAVGAIMMLLLSAEPSLQQHNQCLGSGTANRSPAALQTRQ
jgi:hypothetical protein